jgi:hypothetical protein
MSIATIVTFITIVAIVIGKMQKIIQSPLAVEKLTVFFLAHEKVCFFMHCVIHIQDSDGFLVKNTLLIVLNFWRTHFGL